ncbi:MAG: DNA primase [Cellvibrionales bacterium]|nr:DNA primase [Cellvibrionales bacterium]
MPGRIPQNFINDVLDRLDIIDLIGSRIELRKSGKNYSACCPFHDEKTPSFSVSPDKQFYYCFGCGAGGNAVGFVLDFDKTTFPETIENLAKRVGLEMPAESVSNDSEGNYKKLLFPVIKDADSFYRRSLRDPTNAKKAIEYLKSRGLNGETARNFGIGFASPGWENLLQDLGKNEEKVEQLKIVGLLIERNEEGKLYDRFRNRIMFPIRDVRGRTIGFGGRVLSDEKPKYLNSPETPLFYKGRELYGLYEANRHFRNIENLIVVEGYMDVAVLAQNGVHNAVATLGTAVTIEHLNKIFRYTSEIIFCFDGDEAGRKAAYRALDTSLPVIVDGRSAKFMFLPEGEDPDTIIRKIGAKKFLELVANAMPLSEFIFESLSAEYDHNSVDGKAKLSKLVIPLINKMPGGVFKTLMIRALSKRTDLEESELKSLVESENNNQPTYTPNVYFDEGSKQPIDHHLDHSRLRNISARQIKAHSNTKKYVKMPAIYTLIALLANQPELEKYLPENEKLMELKIDGFSMLDNLTKIIRKNPDYTLNHIIGSMRSINDIKQADYFTKIIATDIFRPLTNSSRDNEKEFKEILTRLQRDSLNEMEPLALFDYLDSKENIDDNALKSLNRAWFKLTSDQKNEEMRSLFNRITSKPRA